MLSTPRHSLVRALMITTVLSGGLFAAGAAPAGSSTDVIAGHLRTMVPGLSAQPQQHARTQALVAAPSVATTGSKVTMPALIPDDYDEAIAAKPGNTYKPRADKEGRLMLSVHLAPGADPDAARAQVEAVGGHVASKQRLFPGHFTAFIPAEKVAAYVQSTAGIKSISLSPAVHSNVGLVTPASIKTLKADIVQRLGYLGEGITIGVLSTSYDLARNDTQNPPLTNADQDVANGDLPGPGNPDGYTQPVLVLDETQADTQDDEGRGMLQILHDIAPAARLCFASAFNGEDAFAQNILSLADPTQGCGADILVDDVGYSDEGIYSDTEVGQAVNAVRNQGVSYFSSAGNGNQSAYNGIFTPISDASARSSLPNNNLKLDQVPAKYTAGGFHNFGAAAGIVDIAKIVQPRTLPDGLFLEWDDPFFQNAMTANYTLLVFDADGNFLEAHTNPNDPSQPYSGVGYGIDIDEPYQEGNIPLGLDANGNIVSRLLQYAVARSDTSTGGAKHFRVFDFQAQYFQLNYLQLFSPAIFGHPAADGAIAVAAEYFRDTAGIEYYSSPGPQTIYFDTVSQLRLPRATVRNKPDIAAVDGAPTSFFFGAPTADGGGFPTFFGTSASAPHAAGVGALLLEAAGGPGSLTPEQMKGILQASGGYHPLDHGQMTTQLLRGNKVVTFSVVGFTPEVTPDGQNQFRIAYNTGGKGVSLTSLTIDASNTGTNQVGRSTEQFSKPFFVGNTVNVDPTAVSSNATSKLANSVTVSFKSGAFLPGGRVNFGVDFDQSTLGNTGITPALLDGSQVTARFSDGTVIQQRLTSRKGVGYSNDDGYGLIDAAAALALIPQAGSAHLGRPNAPIHPAVSND